MSAAPSLEEVTSLMEKSGYNASIVPQLEAYVRASASAGTEYSFKVNRTLLKMYLFHPHLEDESTIALILLLALVEYPTTLQDLFLSQSLIAERIQTREPCASIIRCADLLDSCQFAEFWTAYDAFCTQQSDNKVLHTLAVESKANISDAILPTIALSYRTAPLKMVLGAANIKGASDLTGKAIVENVSNDLVTFVASPDNTKRNSVFQEGVSLGAISSMMIQPGSELSAVVKE